MCLSNAKTKVRRCAEGKHRWTKFKDYCDFWVEYRGAKKYDFSKWFKRRCCTKCGKIQKRALKKEKGR